MGHHRATMSLDRRCQGCVAFFASAARSIAFRSATASTISPVSETTLVAPAIAAGVSDSLDSGIGGFEAFAQPSVRWMRAIMLKSACLLTISMGVALVCHECL